MPAFRIPFNNVSLLGDEMAYVQQTITGGWISGHGPFARRCEKLLEEILEVPRVLLTSSCTHALEMAALLLEIGPGDEVVMPTYTFPSCANAFALRGARPVFSDIRADTGNIDERGVEELVTSRTRVILPVHYAGVACEMDALCALAERHGVHLVEDNAHGLFGRHGERYLGTFGCLATQSFHETKNFTCGEGGALVVNDARHIDRAERILEKGTDRNRFRRGQVDKYTWVDLGSSYLPSDLQAAFLLAQLEARDRVAERRRQVAEAYRTGLGGWAARQNVALPVVSDAAASTNHIFHVLLPTSEARRALIEHLGARGILAVSHYEPLHLSVMGARFGARPGDCPVAEDFARRVLRLPMFVGLSDADVAYVVESITTFTV